MNFAEYLTKYLADNKLSVSQAAKRIGMDRTIFFRYTTGRRTPQSEEQVSEIADRLCMTAEEKDELIDKYDRLSLGDELVSSFHYVNRLMKTLSNADTFNSQSPASLTAKLNLRNYSFVKESSYLNSPTAIVECAFHIFQAEKSLNKSGGIKLIMQPNYKQIEGMLTPIFSDSVIPVEQIICLEKTIEKGYTNLDLIEELITPIFCLKNVNVYYHYDILKSHLNSANLLPNMILTESSALLFDFDMQNGYFTQNKEFIRLLDNRFKELKSQCSPFIDKGSYAYIVQKNNMVIETNKIETFFNQPCIVPCLGRKILADVIINFPMKQYLIDSLISIHGDWDGMEHIPPTSYALCCCSWEGIIEVFRTGMIGEFPDEFYIPFTKEMKIMVLKRMIYLHTNDLHQYLILKSGINLSNTIQIYRNEENHSVTLRNATAENIIQINIAESSIYNSFKNYIDYINKKGLCSTKEETTELLKRILDMVINDKI